MCGIAGLFERDGRVDLGRLHQMSRLLRHRGPDDEGMLVLDPRGTAWRTLGGADTPADVYASGWRYAAGRREGRQEEAHYRVGLMHRRLSIVDLTPAGHQPMCDAAGERWITYNGEVYNFLELRTELEHLGERFVSSSDTEVILAAYRHFGPECLHRLNGMFAFAIWDGRKQELFCARDRFGVKPFYYQWDGRSFAFASEPEALVLTQPHRIAPRLEAVRDLLALDWVDHESHTFFEGLWQLPAGHALTLSERGFAIRRWYELGQGHAAGTLDEWAEEFRRLFTDAVKLRLRADVEVGACLSGGIDSSAVVTTAAKQLARPIHAFTCAYDEGPAFDERSFVRATVQASRAESHVVVPEGGDFWSVFERLTATQDEPTAGPGLYSQWKVMQLAHASGLKVLLDGQGADETLAGYFRYLPARLRDLLGTGRLSAFLAMWGPAAEQLGSTTALGLTLEPWLPRGLIAPLRRAFGQGKDRILSNRLRHLDRGELLRPPRGFDSDLSRQLAFDTLQRLLPSLLRYEDRNSMAFSIETRLPFLDFRLVEFAFSLPDEQRLDGMTTKAILRRSLADRVPRVVLERRDKMGFETPTDSWLRGRFATEARRRLTRPGPLHDWVDPSRLVDELDDYFAGRREIGLQIWRWLSLESWGRRFISGDPRVVERRPDAVLHAGQHRSYVEVMTELERDAAGEIPAVGAAAS